MRQSQTGRGKTSGIGAKHARYERGWLSLKLKVGSSPSIQKARSIKKKVLRSTPDLDATNFLMVPINKKILRSISEPLRSISKALRSISKALRSISEALRSISEALRSISDLDATDS